MANKIKFGLLGVGLLVIGVVVWYFMQPSKDSCEYYERIKFGDQHLGINEHISGKYYPNWYNCNDPKRGDIVRYDITQKGDFHYRLVLAQEGDTLEILRDAQKRGWNFAINEKMYTVNGSPYFFGVYNVPTSLSLFTNDLVRKIHKDDLILVATIPPGYNDSGIFGLFSRRSIKGVVRINDSETEERFNQFLESSFVAEGYNEYKKVSQELLQESPPKLPGMPELSVENKPAKKPTVTSNKPVGKNSKKTNDRKPKKKSN